MSRLCEICDYVKDKIDISDITIEQYIANDNMLKNKQGIKRAEIFPSSGKVIKFKKGDILIGNIRPYFKKIWFATFDGGCSQDVLVFRSKNVTSEFLYSILSNDNFFSYIMLAPKGSKMPRGDQEHIMRYEFNIPNNNDLIGECIYSITKKMDNNKEILNIYNELLDTIYYDSFYNLNGEIKQCSKLNRNISATWDVYDFNHIPNCEIIKTGVDEFDIKNYLATAQINDETIEDGKDITYENREGRANMQPQLNSVWFAKMKDSVKRLCITNNSDWFIEKYILSTGFVGIKCSKELLPYIYCYIAFDNFENMKNKIAHGDTQQAINGDDLNNLFIPIPTENELNDFNKKIYKILDNKMNIIYENQLLFEMRELVLNTLV